MMSAGAVSSAVAWSGRSLRWTLSELDLAGLFQRREKRRVFSSGRRSVICADLGAVGLMLEAGRLHFHARVGGLLLDLLRLRVDIVGGDGEVGLLHRRVVVGERKRDDDRRVVAVGAGPGLSLRWMVSAEARPSARKASMSAAYSLPGTRTLSCAVDAPSGDLFSDELRISVPAWASAAALAWSSASSTALVTTVTATCSRESSSERIETCTRTLSFSVSVWSAGWLLSPPSLATRWVWRVKLATRPRPRI